MEFFFFNIEILVYYFFISIFCLLQPENCITWFNIYDTFHDADCLIYYKNTDTQVLIVFLKNLHIAAAWAKIVQ